MITFRQPFKGTYTITQSFGEKVTDPKGHRGIDYDCPEGTQILASAAGIVRFAGWDTTGYGNCVIIQHSPDRATLYAHLKSIHVRTLQEVKQGQLIGLSGFSGNVVPEGPDGRHLHFEARTSWNKWSTAFDPLNLPLTNVDDTISKPKTAPLKNAAQLGTRVHVTAQDGAKRYNADWTLPYPAAYQLGTHLIRTGRTKKRPGYPYEYAEVYEPPKTFWVAVANEDTQILDDESEVDDG